jgi:hypothetical protein
MRTLRISKVSQATPLARHAFDANRGALDAGSAAGSAEAPVGLRLRTALSHRRLDRQIAAGCALTSPELALRARRLTDPRSRRELAGSIRGAVRSVERPMDRISAAMVDRTAVKHGRAALLDLADQLELANRVTPRGVLLAGKLMSDGLSPMYNPRSERTVTELVREIQDVLLVRPAAVGVAA